jgi:mono/diheme cytochrome c family protein
MKYALTVIVTLAILALGVLLFPYTGLYNVAATEGQKGFEAWYLDTVSEQSIKSRAEAVSVSGDLADSVRVAKGAVAFSQMCQTCHSAPGHERSVTGQGMHPQPPSLSEEATEWEPNEVYWIVEHGIRMAGMPAYGPTHSEEELWEIVAFVTQLPEMTPEQYTMLTAPPADSASTAPRADDGHDHVH